MVWVIVFIVGVVLIGGFWIGNTIRWTKQNNNLKRQSPLNWSPDNYESRPEIREANRRRKRFRR